MCMLEKLSNKLRNDVDGGLGHVLNQKVLIVPNKTINNLFGTEIIYFIF